MILQPVVTTATKSINFAAAYQASPRHPVMAAPIYGPLTVTLPVSDEPAAQIAGTIPFNFLDEFYHRIHLKPERIDFVNLIAQQTRTFEVWNAHFDTRLLSAIENTGSYGGLTLSGAPAPPLAYGPLQSRVYTLTAQMAGDPVIEAQFAFNFGTEVVRLSISGRRIVVWPLRPDWAEGLTERLEWLTDVLTAHDGKEQRIRLRRHARRALEMGWIADGRHAMIASTLLAGWGGRKYCVPLWMERDILANAVAAGTTAVTVTDAALKDYRVGGYIVLWASETQTEAIEIAAISGNVITLKTPVANTYPAHSSACPAMVARIDGEARAQRPTDRIMTGRIRFIDEAALDLASQEIGSVWQGYAVLDERPDFSKDAEEDWTRTLEILDNLTGIVVAEDTTGLPVIRRTYGWIIQGRQAIHRWKRWAAARAGRVNPLWLPSFMESVDIVQNIQQSDTAILVRNALHARYAADLPHRAALRIETTAGQVYHRRVTAAAEIDADREQLSLDAALGTAVPVSSIRRALWMGLARLESDALEIHYETDNLARIEATFRIVVQ